MLIKYACAWIGLVFLAILNAAVRNSLFLPRFGEQTAHQISTLLFLILIWLYVWILASKWKITSAKLALRIGMLWFILTIAFEFLFGYYVMNNPWSALLHDYNLLAGRLWSLIPVFTAFAPYLCYRLRSKTG
jgi:hypothetical protein